MKKLEADVVIVGAGLLGSSTAMHLSQLCNSSVAKSILVLDLDLDGVFSSSELNAGGVRATWNSEINACISKLSIDYYASIKDEVGFRQNGYFWMYSAEHWPSVSARLKANPYLSKYGMQFLSPSEVTARYPFIDKTSDLGGATFSPSDGLLNANLLKMHFRSEARKKGVKFLNRTWVNKVRQQGQTLELNAWQWPDVMDHDEIKEVLTQKDAQGSESVEIKAGVLVNCSGAWAKRFASYMGCESVSQAVRRQVSVFDCKDVDLTPYGMFVDASGVYFHAEANNILGGYATPDEPVGYNFEYQGDSFFEQYVWSPLYQRSSKFESLKHLTGWAGLYEVSPDRSGIVGKLAGFENVYEAHSFSGRGAMQSYGAGLGLAELICKGRYETLDLSALSGTRFKENKLISEGMII